MNDQTASSQASAIAGTITHPSISAVREQANGLLLEIDGAMAQTETSSYIANARSAVISAIQYIESHFKAFEAKIASEFEGTATEAAADVSTEATQAASDVSTAATQAASDVASVTATDPAPADQSTDAHQAAPAAASTDASSSTTTSQGA